jgi:hypothetical protein
MTFIDPRLIDLVQDFFEAFGSLPVATHRAYIDGDRDDLNEEERTEDPILILVLYIPWQEDAQWKKDEEDHHDQTGHPGKTLSRDMRCVYATVGFHGNLLWNQNEILSAWNRVFADQWTS